MKKITVIILSVMIVSLSALIIPLENWRNGKNKGCNITQEIIVINNDTHLLSELTQKIPVEVIKSDYELAAEEMDIEVKAISDISDKGEWFQAYKLIVEKYGDIIDSPETIYDYFDEEELDLLFHVVQAEIGDEYSFEQKVNVASVIFNRFWHDRFPDTLSEILIASQFSVISNGRYKSVDVSEETILACEYAFVIGDTTDGCLFFDSNNKLKYEYVYNDGVHNFYKLKEHK